MADSVPITPPQHNPGGDKPGGPIDWDKQHGQKPGGPADPSGGGRTPPYTPPSPTPPDTPPGRPVPPGTPPLNPITRPPVRDPINPLPPPRDPRPSPIDPPEPTPPGTPPGRPVPPGTPPLKPIEIDGRTPPEETNPDEEGNFNKGQVREQLTPNGMGGPTDPGGLGEYNPYNTGGKPGSPGTGGGGTGGGGWGPRNGMRGRPTTYDPTGIGQSNYGLSRTIGNRGEADGSSENVYGMTGVNAATGYNGPARFGVVGGQGGYGSGMVAPEYTGPQFDSAKDVLKAYRQQRRRGERSGIARPANPGGGIGGGTGGGGAVGGGPGTPPPGSGGWTKDMNYGQKPGAPAGGAGGAGAQGASGKPGSPASNAEVAAGGGAGGGAAGGGAGGKPGTPPPPSPTGATGGAAGADGAPPSWYEAGRFNGTPFGDLVQSSTGGGNIYKKLNGDDQDLYHYDPNAGWKHMTAQEYAGYNNPADFYKDPNQYAKQAGAVQTTMEKRNGMWQAKAGTGTYA